MNNTSNMVDYTLVKEQLGSETITTTQLLDFLAKADKVSSHVNVTKKDEGYKITVMCDWYNDGHFDDRSTFVTDEGKVECKYGYEDFDTMNADLNHLVREEEEREMKRQKRKELLSRLTDEEKELLGVK